MPVAPGRYRVRLHFAEIWNRSPGNRVFGVAIEGRTMLSELDLAGEFGYAKPGHRQLGPIAVTDGLLDIEFQRVIGEPKISAIEIVRLQ